MSAFGGLTDHFGLATSNLVLVDSESTPVAQNRVDAQDENGDIVASAFHGNTSGDLSEVSCTYSVKSGILNTSDLKCGEIVEGGTRIIITSIEVSTSNDGWPQVTVSGTAGAFDVCSVSGKLNTYTLPSVFIAGCKRAQPIGFTVIEGRLTSSSISASVEIAQQENGVGEPVAHGVSGGTLEVSAELVRIDAAPAWSITTPGIGLTETQAPSVSEGQASWHTSTATAAGTLERDDD